MVKKIILIYSIGSQVVDKMNFVMRASKKNTHFNIMVCGSSGIGKTSFIEMFLRKFHANAADELIN